MPQQQMQQPQQLQQPQQPQARMATPQMQQRGPLQQQQMQQQQMQQQQQMKRTQPQMQQQQQKSQGQSSALPPLPPPNKNAGQLYGIPLHPLIMFQTHDNKLNEHDLSITECFDQLKEFEGRLIVVEGNGTHGAQPVVTAGAGAATAQVGGAASDLNELMNDGVFINGVVDNIMATTNFASIVENIIPLKEENETLRQRISEQELRSEQMQHFIQQLEERLRNIENELAQTYEEVSAPSSVVETAETTAVIEVAVVDDSGETVTIEEASAEASSVPELVSEA
jgi:regulator of replication initiation timing